MTLPIRIAVSEDLRTGSPDAANDQVAKKPAAIAAVHLVMFVSCPHENALLLQETNGKTAAVGDDSKSAICSIGCAQRAPETLYSATRWYISDCSFPTVIPK
jgi:hypothetical protein